MVLYVVKVVVGLEWCNILASRDRQRREMEGQPGTLRVGLARKTLWSLRKKVF